ncbi:histidine kinase dimerization/phosphoacceptor domain -containing protein [Hymenobacter guriensis]|uniref:histidine kinase n=1 Tax=Hymenobacter guriensis TaxID=2793065 RepID=A0ABS0KXH1_9BACT|nr:histidine kinase dimerization/phosphoacceptor domain -containing protein [Hymenobacter guriensis]MBG8552545.1 tetratricopeptide repeat protein [Hymenobacter guriensis]
MRLFLLLFCLSWGAETAVLAQPVSPDTSQLRQLCRQTERQLLTSVDSAARNGRAIIRQSRHLGYAYGEVQGYYLLGCALRNQSQFDSSLYYGQQALTRFEAQHRLDGQAAAYTLLAQNYKRMADGQQVQQLTRKGLRLALRAAAVATQGPHYRELSSAYLVQGIIYRDLGQLDSAKTCYLRAMRVAREHPFQPSTLPVCYANYGQFLMDSGESLDEAIGYFRRAIPLYRAQHNRNGQEHAYRNLSWAYRKQGRLTRAVELGDSALALGRAIGDPHRLVNSLQAAYLAYRAAARYEQAVKLLDEYKTRNDSLMNGEVARAVAGVEAAYAAEKQEARIARLAEDNVRQQRQLGALALGAGALALLCGVAVWQYRIIRRTNAKLHATNRTVLENSQRITEQAGRLTVLMQELHHRVKNNLAIVSSLLRLQAKRLTDESAVQAVQEGQQRVEAMALVHQRLYQTEDVTTVDMPRYVADLTDSLMTTYGYTPDSLDLTVNINQTRLEVDVAVPLGLILNELLTNAFKHALPLTPQPALRIYLGRQHDTGKLLLEVQDNGPGISPETAGQSTTSFGQRLILLLSEQLGGQTHYLNQAGTLFRLLIPSAGEGQVVPELAIEGKPARG